MGTGAYQSIVEACQATIKIEDSTAPSAKSKKTYDAAYPVYQQLYRSLKNDFRAIAGLVAK